PDDRVARRSNLQFHLHGFEYQQHVARLDAVSRGHVYGDDGRGHGGGQCVGIMTSTALASSPCIHDVGAAVEKDPPDVAAGDRVAEALTALVAQAEDTSSDRFNHGSP